MSLNSTPSSERVHIAFFGLRNVGKSSLVNAVTGQDLSLVSDVKGTTTDPVKKAMELLPLGPVVIIDTPGMDDEGSLGSMRVARARKVLAHTDIAVLVTEARVEDHLEPMEEEIISLFRERSLPYVIAYNKSDLLPANIRAEKEAALSGAASFDNTVNVSGKILVTSAKSEDGSAKIMESYRKERRIYVSAIKNEGIWDLKEMLADFAREWEKERRCLVSDLIQPGGTVVLVVPIDESAPKGRLILPQQHVMRDLLDAGAWFMTCQPEELTEAISRLKEKPALVITDSQAFKQVAADLPQDVLLTSFSILFARYKGELEALVEGAEMLGRLKDGDRVLISEGCTHHRQCNDLGTVKIPGWIRKHCGADPIFEFTSGGDFPEDLSGYQLVIHCGGCMLNDKEMARRIRSALRNQVPIVNYGIAIAEMNGILARSLEVFK